MKLPYFFIAFILSNLFFVVAIIYKNSRRVELLYTQQKLERQYAQLMHEEAQVESELCALKNHQAIRSYAQTLGMQQIALRNIKHTHHD